MDKKYLRLLSGLALVMALGLSGAAWASSISAVGAPVEVGSWAQTFQWSPPPAHIDTIESFIVSGATGRAGRVVAETLLAEKRRIRLIVRDPRQLRSTYLAQYVNAAGNAAASESPAQPPLRR